MIGLVRYGAVALALAIAAPAHAGCSAAGDAREVAEQLTHMTNQFRAQHGLSQVRVSGALVRAASDYACEMAATGSFGHYGRNGSDIKSRAKRAGYGKACTLAENLAWGYKGANVVMSGWEQSAKHLANLVNRKVKEIGVGVAYSGTTPYYVLMLGSRC